MTFPARTHFVPLLLRRCTLRHWRSAPRRSLLLVVILALGIAVFFSIRLANRAAVASFQNFTDIVTAQSDWIITPPSGTLTEKVLPELRERLLDLNAHIVPVIETTAARPRTKENETIGSRETFQIVGIDLVAAQNLRADRTSDRSWFDQAAAATTAPGGNQFWEILRDPRTVFISEALAQEEGLAAGESMPLVINDEIVALRVAGVIPQTEGAPSAPRTLLIMDLPAVQSLAHRTGQLDRVEFILERGGNEDRRRELVRERLAASADGRWRVATPADRRDSAATMTAAFRLNLTILSLIALLVGLYLVFQALDGAVVRRREEIGILRSLGVEEKAIRRAWLWEAAILGGVGGVAGILLGWGGAQLSVRFVGRTVNALYYATSVDAARLSWVECLMAMGLAVGASLLAGWMPAREAARTPPAQILARHGTEPVGSALRRREWLGVAALLAGVVLVQLPPWRVEGGGRLPWAGYVAALFWTVGAGLLGGTLLRWLARSLGRLGSRFATWRLAVSHTSNPSGRHRLAVAGLVCAVSMTAGMAILVASFDTTMRGWIERTFMADLYISSDGAQSASTENRIRPETWREILDQPGVAEANLVQAAEVRLADGGTMLAGAELSFLRDHTRMAWLEEPKTDEVFETDRNEGLALVSESFSERFRIASGDFVEVPTPSGPRRLQVEGVFADYSNERGSILVDRRHFATWFGHEMLSSLILELDPGLDAPTRRAEILARHPGLTVYTNEHLRREILRVFRQTFSITYALEVIGVAVAVMGLGLTLASVLIERRDELTTLRAMGMDRGQLARSAAWEGALVAVSGVAAGLAVSVALGWLLIYVINKQSFGWTLQFDVPWILLVLLAGLIVAAGAAVSYGVGRWGANLPADREE